MFKSTSQLIAIILGVGMVGQNFFVLNMLSKRDSDMPNIAQFTALFAFIFEVSGLSKLHFSFD